jgi:hypothetical protein
LNGATDLEAPAQPKTPDGTVAAAIVERNNRRVGAHDPFPAGLSCSVRESGLYSKDNRDRIIPCLIDVKKKLRIGPKAAGCPYQFPTN